MGLSNVLTEARDAVTRVPALYSQEGAAVVGEEQLLLQDSFAADPPDTAGIFTRWIKTQVTTGTVSRTGAVLTLFSGTGAAGECRFESQEPTPYMGGQTTILRGVVRFGTDGIAGNRREFGLWQDANNYIFFVLDETQFFCRCFSGGVAQAPDIPITIVQADDNTFMDLEIRVTKTEARFLINTGSDVFQVGHFSAIGTQTPIQQGIHTKVWMRTVNIGSTVDNTLMIDEVSLTRVSHGWKNGPNRVAPLNTLSTTPIFVGQGELVGVVVGEDNGQSWSLAGNLTALYRKGGTGQGGIYVPLNVVIWDASGLTFTAIGGATADRLSILYRT